MLTNVVRVFIGCAHYILCGRLPLIDTYRETEFYIQLGHKGGSCEKPKHLNQGVEVALHVQGSEENWVPIVFFAYHKFRTNGNELVGTPFGDTQIILRGHTIPLYVDKYKDPVLVIVRICLEEFLTNGVQLGWFQASHGGVRKDTWMIDAVSAAYWSNSGDSRTEVFTDGFETDSIE